MKSDTTRTIIEKGVKQLLAEAQIPASQHMKVIELLRKQMRAHKDDIDSWGQIALEHTKQIIEHRKHEQKHTEQLSKYDSLLKDIAAKDWTGAPGHTPVKGVDYFDGEAGEAPEIDTNAIVETVLSRIPVPKDKEDKPLDMEGIVSAVLDAIKDKKAKRLSIDELDGLEPFIMRIRQSVRDSSTGFMFNGKRYKFEELMHGGGTSGGVFGGKQEKSTTVPNGILTTFAFAHTPGVIVWNGAIQTLTDDYIVSGMSIVFTSSAGIPQTGDKIINIYA